MSDSRKNKGSFLKRKTKLKPSEKEGLKGRQKDNYDESSPIIQSFLVFQKELDGKYDRRERIIKLSRDVTIASKRVIFLLHRFSNDEEMSNFLPEVDSKIDEIKGCLVKIHEEVVEEDPYKFARAFSGGLQEFIEAITFLHYIKDGELISYEELCGKYLIFDTNYTNGVHNSNILLNPLDYILGVADLTGELMRMAINCIGSGSHEKSQKICYFLRRLHEQFLLIPAVGIKDLKQKMRVLNQSLQKVESACYTVHVRGSEVPTHMLVDLIQQKQVCYNTEPSVDASDQ